MTITEYCPCGFHVDQSPLGVEVLDRLHDEWKAANPDTCCNCGGQRCMSCVLRHQHDRCVDDCPDCTERN